MCDIMTSIQILLQKDNPLETGDSALSSSPRSDYGSLILIVCLFSFDTESYCVAQPSPALNSQQFSFSFPGVGITALLHHTWFIPNIRPWQISFLSFTGWDWIDVVIPMSWFPVSVWGSQFGAAGDLFHRWCVSLTIKMFHILSNRQHRVCSQQEGVQMF